MKTEIKDSDFLRLLEPSKISLYLQNHGWIKKDQIDDKFEIYIHEDFAKNQYDIKLPLNQRFNDYPYRMRELLETLEKFENRSQNQIVKELQVLPSDIIRFKLSTPDSDSGTISLDDAANFVIYIKEMILAAASSEIDPKPYYPSKKVKEAVQFVENAKLAQTEQSSFVIPIISEISQIFEEQQKLVQMEPFERRVVKKLASGLIELNIATEEYLISNSLETFSESVFNGVSANLIDSIIGIGKLSPESPSFEIFFSWTNSVSSLSDLPSNIEIKNSYLPIYEVASEFLKQFQPIENFVVFGSVVRLARSEKSKKGKITVTTEIDGEGRSVSIELPDKDYHSAIYAHDRQNKIKCIGRLVKDGNYYHLENPKDFEVIRDLNETTIEKWLI